MKPSFSCSFVNEENPRGVTRPLFSALSRLAAATMLGFLFVISVACQGASGSDGAQGPVGPPGPPGASGLDGRAGIDGRQGQAGPEGPAGPLGPVGETGSVGSTGPTGEPGPQGTSYTEDEVLALIQGLMGEITLAAGPVAGDPVTGGQLFDNWPVVTGILPEGEHRLWGIQSTNAGSGPTTWRCSECHGWDYKGAGGEYASGEHYTGFPGLVEFSRVLTQAQILEFLHGGVDARHDFTDWLTDDQLLDLSAFVKTEILNLAIYVDYETLEPRNGYDADRGKLLYSRTCASCHGASGSNIALGDTENPVTLSEYAKTSPFQTIHKTRFGQPGVSGMPVAENRGWAIDDVMAVLGYVQSLEP